MSRIVYTLTDESPQLATASLLPILRAFTAPAGVEVQTRDISLAARILAVFADDLPTAQRVPDALSELGALCQDPRANIVKLPNISASLPQLLAAIAELQEKGYALPDYPQNPQSETERRTRARYDAVKGSAVNPVLREGNSDRRPPQVVKEYARKHPHRMGEWHAECRTRIAAMEAGDFRANEVSHTVASDGHLDIVFVPQDGTEETLNAALPVKAGDIVDATFLDLAALDEFLRAQIATAQRDGLLFSLHLKATMMKVSDPLIFGRCLRAFLPVTFSRHGDELAAAGVDPANGLAALLSALTDLPAGKEVTDLVEQELAAGPRLAMVDSARGVTNLHVPSDVIIDASLPAMIRAGGCMWDADGKLAETLAVVPDSSYAAVYQETVRDCRENGAFDPRTLGSVANVGLMAQKAEEYGSHDKTHQVTRDGRVEVRDAAGNVLLSREVKAGDIFRACLTADVAVRDWVRLAVERARVSGQPAVFWLDDSRAHERALAEKVAAYLPQHDTSGLDLRVLGQREATRFTLARFRAGADTIAVTGNVLRDYLTDLFPIMELGTSAKMLSVVPLLAGGSLFETGAGGTAPKLAQLLTDANHLAWDSLGEYLAVGESLRLLAREGNPAAGQLANALERAVSRMLEEGCSPSEEEGGVDTRQSHFYLALFWAQELASCPDGELAQRFAPLAEELTAASWHILEEIQQRRGEPVSLDGHYLPSADSLARAMRPSATFAGIIDSARAVR
ncbi:NADP-dependent isocitrate dehydrogenase [Dermabacteraceae bacterium TAE3-ERU27]|nr:NADP-dependent isocitrate dehydrogenase [Dermabacteraceae bacterium TAE3-ERU27]